MNLPTVSSFAVSVACSLAIASCGGGPAQGGAGGAGGAVATASPSTPDAGSTDFIYGTCPATIALTGGLHEDAVGAYVLKWPAGWTGGSGGPYNFGVDGPYEYLPTNATTTKQTFAPVFVSTYPSAGEAEAQKRVDDLRRAYDPVSTRDVVIAGRHGYFRFFEEPPPQSGCANCPVDPGPDVITIELVVVNGTTVVQMYGSARVNAPPEVFCQIQSIELGVELR